MNQDCRVLLGRPVQRALQAQRVSRVRPDVTDRTEAMASMVLLVALVLLVLLALLALLVAVKMAHRGLSDQWAPPVRKVPPGYRVQPGSRAHRVHSARPDSTSKK